jgi:hypothetical protein
MNQIPSPVLKHDREYARRRKAEAKGAKRLARSEARKQQRAGAQQGATA